MPLQNPVASRTLLKELLSAASGGSLQYVGRGDAQNLHNLAHLVHLAEEREREREMEGKRERERERGGGGSGG